MVRWLYKGGHMCGRVILTLSEKMIAQILEGTLDINSLDIDDFVPKYNLSPGQRLLSIIQHKEENRAGFMDWKFIPSYAEHDKSGYQFVNARMETISEKRSFSDAFFKRRCLIVTNGFYEWHRAEVKTPYLFYPEDGLLFLAGIWNPYFHESGEKSYGFSLITTEANEDMAPVHHRLPVIIKNEDLKTWLNPDTQIDQLKRLMAPIESGYLKKHQVSNYVNSVKNKGPECIQAVS